MFDTQINPGLYTVKALEVAHWIRQPPISRNRPPCELFSFWHLDLSLAPLETVCPSPLICEICGICGFKFGIYLYAPCGDCSGNSSAMLAAFAWQIPRSVTGIMRESVRARISASDRELKIVVASPSNVPEGKAIRFAKKVTKQVRISQGAGALLVRASGSRRARSSSIPETPIHLSLQHFESVKLSLDRTVAPRFAHCQFQPRIEGREFAQRLRC